MIEVKSTLSFGENIRRRMSEIFVDGFGKHFTFFSQDKEVLIRAFEHMFVLDVFYVAILDGKIVGIGACTDGKAYSVEPKWRELLTHFGLIKGTIAYFVLKHEFHKPAMRSGPRVASVEFFATDSRYRGKGIASAIIKYFLNNPEYDEFILEVADTNIDAVSLYKKLGFVEFARKKEKHPEVSGINYLIYMSYKKTNPA
jgi:ribosomal protein S18 acetylase RimI-like enzyme